MPGQSCAAAFVILCVLVTTAHSFLTHVPSRSDHNSFPVSQTDIEAPGDYHGQRIDIELTHTPEMTYFPTHTAKALQGFDIDPSKINVTENATHVCVSYGFLKVCFKKSLASELICGLRLSKILTLGCRLKDEEKYLGLCYKKCSILTNHEYPLRTATNTCTKDGCDPDEGEDAGLCYPNCKPYYKGVGPVFWGYCDHFCGSEYTDVGLYCYLWWPPKSCHKPSYGRGVGTLPYAPWTKGLGCNGFGINGDGGCALIDVLNFIKVPYIDCP